MLESYNDLKSLKPNDKLNQSVNRHFGDYDKMLERLNGYIEYAKKDTTNVCKQ